MSSTYSKQRESWRDKNVVVNLNSFKFLQAGHVLRRPEVRATVEKG
jgi:hypothetical protein